MQALSVADVMTRDVVALYADEDLRRVGAQMERHRFRHLPVVDDARGLVGLVSQRDLLRWSASRLDGDAGARDAVIEAVFTVRDVMTRVVQTCRRDEPLAEVARRMVDAKLGCLPVVDDGRRVIGIVTEHDLLRVLVRLLDVEDAAVF